MATRWKVDVAVRAGEQALEVTKSHVPRLEARLPAGFFDGLKRDIAIARTSGDVQASRATKRAATVSQDEALREGLTLATGLRAVVRSGAPGNKALWKEFGVGTTVTPTVRSVSSALATILAAADKRPAETSAVGILAEDLQRAQTYLRSISSIDSDQEAKKVSSKQATAQLNAAVDRIADGLYRLAAVAKVALSSGEADAVAGVLPSAPKRKPAPKPA